MADRIPARLTPAEGRRFAFPVGIAFLVFAGVSRWRGHEMPPLVLGGLGAALLLAGLLIPGFLGPVYRGWMAAARAISKVTTPIAMGIVYYVVLTPIALVMRLARGNPMKHPDRNGSYWVVIPSGGRSRLDRQF